MKQHILITVLIGILLAVRASAAGLPPWQFGMSKSQVVGFKDVGPYKSFSNGDLETFNGWWHGRKTNVQFFFQGDRLRRIGVYLYQGTDPKGGIPEWRDAYEALQKDYGKIDMPDVHADAKNAPFVNADVLAIAAAANADIIGETRMAPSKQPNDMHVSARFFTGLVQGKKCYYVAVFYDPNA